MSKQVALYKLPEVLETAGILDSSVLERYNESLGEFNEQAKREDIQDLNDFKWDYTRKEGLARACFGGYGDWDSSDECLDNSFGDGRVVLVSAKSTSQNFLEEQIVNLQKKEK